MTNALLELIGIGKRFPGVVALDKVSFAISSGEIVALIGENGAGKSTLMKVIGGVYQPDDGEIRVDGKHVAFRNVSDSIASGIGFVHQELNNLDNIDVAGNVYLGREPKSFGFLNIIDRGKMERDTQALLDRLGLNVSPSAPLSTLSIAQQQMVEIAKALSLKARVIIMDEPTSSLTLQEAQRLIEVSKELRDSGVSIIYISHRLGELPGFADRIVALRDGQNAGTLTTEEITHDNMVKLMIGRDIEQFFAEQQDGTGEKRLQVKDLQTARYPQHKVSFDVAAGEIVGMAGLVGAGRTEVSEAVFGVRPALSGDIILDGTPITVSKADDAIKRGLYLVPEDRRHNGLILEMTIRENITLPEIKRFLTGGLINMQKELDVSREYCGKLAVRTPSTEAFAGNLSGGNQQKVVLAKWFALAPKVIIFDEPTRGVDVGAKAEIYTLMRGLAKNGVAVLMISSDMEEVLGVSDRILVMHEGQISGQLGREEYSEEAVMRLAVGGGNSNGASRRN
jgi:ribose transport system ATP-binding protein